MGILDPLVCRFKIGEMLFNTTWDYLQSEEFLLYITDTINSIENKEQTKNKESQNILKKLHSL